LLHPDSSYAHRFRPNRRQADRGDEGKLDRGAPVRVMPLLVVDGIVKRLDEHRLCFIATFACVFTMRNLSGAEIPAITSIILLLDT
jgi:hypothetical protein